MAAAEAQAAARRASWPRANVLGVGVHAVNMDDALRIVFDAVREHRKGYVCVTGVHGVMEAQKDEVFRRALNSAMLVTPDGMPTVWMGKAQGHRDMDRVFGPEFMWNVCSDSVSRQVTHFLYGGNPGVAEQLRDNLCNSFPGLKIVGTYTPPFRPLNPDEESELIEQVSQASPDFFWVGLSTPKQERFMAAYLDKLDTRVMVGVGAAFDVHTGRIKDCDQWIKRAGLQWAHRLMQEPRRLWKRYLINNPKFIVCAVSQLVGFSDYSFE